MNDLLERFGGLALMVAIVILAVRAVVVIAFTNHNDCKDLYGKRLGGTNKEDV